MILRTATLDDQRLLEHWDQQPHVQASGGDDDVYDWAFELPRQVDWREILIAEVDGRPIGVLVIIDPLIEETHYWGECDPNLRAIDIWIGEKSDIGKGFGTEMMRLGLRRCFSDERVQAVLIDPLSSNTGARRFYETLGFQFVESRIFGSDHCAVYRLDRPSPEARTDSG